MEMELPWVAYNTFFECLSKNDLNITVKCKLCVKLKTLSTSITSSSNLKKHIAVSNLVYPFM